MFEQSVVLENSRKSSCTFILATSLEIVAIAATILGPLFFIPPPPMPAPPPPVARYLPHVKLVRVQPADVPRDRAVPITRRSWALATLVAPRKVPHGFANLAGLEPLDMDLSGNSDAGLPGMSLLGSDAPPIPAPPPPVAKPQPPSSDPLRVSQGVQEAKLIYRVVPRYPPLAIQIREFGTVHLVAIVGKDGRVRSVQVLDGPVFLRQAAVEAIKQWIYKPTLLNGQPIEVIAPIDVHFTLNN